MTSRFAVLFGLVVLATLGGCASRSMQLVNPDDESPRLSARENGVSAWGGGSGSSRGWDRRVIVSLTLRNERAKALRLDRQDLGLRLGPRRVSAHTLIGSEGTGRVETIRLPPGAKVEFIAQFSTSFGVRKSGKIVLRFREEGSEESVVLEVPIRLQEPPELLKAPGVLDRAERAPDEPDQGS